MRIFLFIGIILLSPSTLLAQKERGINFMQLSSWKEIIEKAKTENKYIFVDCYATWCIPCKKMDKEVYMDDTVGSYLNQSFISVKVQMDTTIHDNDVIKDWYSTAHHMKIEYNVYAYPTLLFFSPDGKPLHKAIGACDNKKFLQVVNEALNTQTQYYKLIRTYQEGKLPFSEMAQLAQTAKKYNDSEIAQKIANSYIDNHLALLNDITQLKKDDIFFIRQFINNSSSKIFNLLYRHPKAIDKIMGDEGYDESFISSIIQKEEIYPRLWQSGKPIVGKPDWHRLETIVAKKYNNSYARRTIAASQVTWYGTVKDWKQFIRYLVLWVDKYSSPQDKNNEYFINNQAWTIFSHSDVSDRKELAAAIGWIEHILEKRNDDSGIRSATIDTYANLLYKIGQKEKAIEWEKKAVELNPNDGDARSALAKMQNKILK